MKRGAFIRSLIALPAISTIAAKLIQPTNGQPFQIFRFGEEINPGTIIEDMTIGPVHEAELVQFSAVLVPANEQTRLLDCQAVPDQLSKETEADGKLLRDGR